MSEDLPPKPLKIYPSGAGFVGQLGLVAPYESGCPRFAVGSIGANRAPLDPIYERLGKHHEDWYAAKLGPRVAYRELPIVEELAPGVVYSGRFDFETDDEVIHETKASLSKTFYYQTIKKGKYKIGHLAQLISYMIKRQRIRGVIATGFYEESNTGEFVLKAARNFDVLIQDSGYIYVDGMNSGWTVVDQMKHTETIKQALVDRRLVARPINHIEFMGPCRSCPLNRLCYEFDKNQITEEQFKEQATTEINNAPAKVRAKPAVKVTKPRRTK